MPPRYLLLLLFLVVFLVTIIQLEVLSIAFQKLGLSPRGALLLVRAALFGSSINIPVESSLPRALPVARSSLSNNAPHTRTIDVKMLISKYG